MRTLIIAILCVFAVTPVFADAPRTDGARFAAEHEVLNHLPTQNGTNVYARINISPDNPFVYADEASLNAFLGSGTGVLYLGFPECPWCRTLLPVLLESMAGYTGDVYYYNLLADRDILSLDEDGNVVVAKEGTALYATLLDRLDAFIGEYAGLNDPTIKRIYLPTTVYMKNGEVVDVHLVTIAGQTDAYEPLTDEQHDELLNELNDSLRKTL